VPLRIGCAPRAFRSLRREAARPSTSRLPLRAVLPVVAVVVASLQLLRRRPPRLPPLRPRRLCRRLLLRRLRRLRRCPPRPLLLLPRLTWRLWRSSSAPLVRRVSWRSVCRVSRRLLRWRTCLFRRRTLRRLLPRQSLSTVLRSPTFLFRRHPLLWLRPRRLLLMVLRMLRSGAALTLGSVCCASIRARSTHTLRTPPARRPGASPARSASPLLAPCRLPIVSSLRLSTSRM